MYSSLTPSLAERTSTSCHRCRILHRPDSSRPSASIIIPNLPMLNHVSVDDLTRQMSVAEVSQHNFFPPFVATKIRYMLRLMDLISLSKCGDISCLALRGSLLPGLIQQGKDREEATFLWMTETAEQRSISGTSLLCLNTEWILCFDCFCQTNQLPSADVPGGH